jgi:hypothetical protein
MVLSLNGREDIQGNAYEVYLNTDDGFRGVEAKDKRLKTKQEIYAFRLNGKPFAAPFCALEGGKVFWIGDTTVFLFRAQGSPLYQSTVAYKTRRGKFEKIGGKWIYAVSGSSFDIDDHSFLRQVDGIEPLTGFDTFWYTWSPFYPDTEILK